MKHQLFLKWISPIFLLTSFFIKRDKNKYIFSEWLGLSYSDSAKYIFEKALQEKNKNVMWITKSKDIYKKLMAIDKPVYYAYSIKGIYHQITSKYFICTVSSRDFNCFTCGFGSKVIMLGHGLPIKEQNHSFTSFQKFKRFIRFKTIDKYYKSASESEFFDDIASRQYHLKKKDLIRIPSARCDLFKEKLNDEQRNNFLSINNINENQFNIIYLPTHRNEGHNADEILKALDDLDSLAVLINKKLACSIKIHLKVHHYDSDLIVNSTHKNINILKFSTDLSSLFQIADIFIGDYSGVCYDFIYFQKPMIAYVPDYESYILNSRNLYCRLEEIYGAVTHNSKELYIALEKLVQDKSSDGNLFLPKYERILPKNLSLSSQCWEKIKEC
jgi:CDP-glycerol glycerophosphotransferase (TagB/SpsB family)